MSLKRYNPEVDSSNCFMGMHERADGDWVDVEDVVELLKLIVSSVECDAYYQVRDLINELG